MSLRAAIEQALEAGVTEPEVKSLLAQERAASSFAASAMIVGIAEEVRQAVSVDPEITKELFKSKWYEKAFKKHHRWTALTSQKTANSIGRWVRGERRTKPYLFYSTMRDRKVRTKHKRMEGVCLPRDHEFWNDWYPPNGWGCRCIAFQVDEAGLENLGISVTSDDDVPSYEMLRTKNQSTGKMSYTADGIDPGWSFHVGKRGHQMLMESYESKLRLALAAGGLAWLVAALIAKNAEATETMVAEDVAPDLVVVGMTGGEVLCTMSSDHARTLDLDALAKTLAKIQALPGKFSFADKSYKINRKGVISNS